MVSVNIPGLVNLVGRFTNSRILVIGDLMLDRFIRGNVSGISDEAPVPLLEFTSEVIRPGGAANAICNIRSLGGSVAAVGVVGDDPEGKCLVEILVQAGADISGVLIHSERQTVQKTRILAEKLQQNIIRIDKHNKFDIEPELAELLLEKIKILIDSVDTILISDYNDGVVTPDLLDVLIPLAKAKGKTIIVDSKGDHLLDYQHIDVVKIDHQVASIITGVGQINETSIRNIGQWMLTQLGSEYVLITQGKDGMTLFDRNGDVFHIPSIAKQVREVAGVADTVGAVLALSLSVDNSQMIEAAVLANTTAGIKVGKLGTATVTRDELVMNLTELDTDNMIQTYSK